MYLLSLWDNLNIKNNERATSSKYSKWYLWQIEIISFAYTQHGYKFYNVKCLLCNSEYVRSFSHTSINNNPHCKYCYGNVTGTYGSVEVLSMSHKKDNKIMYNTKCVVCGKESIRRLDHILGTKNPPKYCKYCKDKMSVVSSIETTSNSLFSNYRSGAKTRNLEFTLNKEEFYKIVTSNCYYCGAIPVETLTSKSNNRTTTPFLHNGVNRVDSLLGYTVKNTVPCCAVCNLMKNKF